MVLPQDQSDRRIDHPDGPEDEKTSTSDEIPIYYGVGGFL